MPPDELKRGVSLAIARPNIAAEWHPTKNGALTPWHVGLGTHQKVWWLGSCCHEWNALISNRVRGTGCPYCASRKVLIDFNDLESQNPEVASEWHPTRNGELKPSQVLLTSRSKVWWLGDCGHEWNVRPADRIHYRTSCPFCNGNSQTLPGINDLETINPEVAVEWHPTKNKDLTSSSVRFGSNKRVWWLGVCGHEWDDTISHRTNMKTKCPICQGFRVLVGFNDLGSQAPKLAAEWHPTRNGELLPEMLVVSSNKKIWWKCSKGHEWRTSPNGRSFGSGCPSCADYGFSPAKEGWLYLLENSISEMQQIGITNVPEHRLEKHRKSGWVPIDIRGPMNGDLAANLERDGLNSLRLRGADLGKRGGSGKFDGFTEAWSIHALQLENLAQLILWIQDDDLSTTSSDHKKID